MNRTVVFELALSWFLAASNLCSQALGRSQVASPMIHTDSVVATQPNVLRRDAEALQEVGCNGHYIHLDHPSTVGDFIGGKVTAIRVVLFASTDNRTDKTGLAETMNKVWDGRFQSASCQIDWAEWTYWSFAAIVEFEDGKQSNLITDGFHIAFQDHSGKNWFVRLLPSAQ